MSVQIIGCYFKVHAVQFYYILITYPEGLPKVKNFLMVAVQYYDDGSCRNVCKSQEEHVTLQT